MEDSVPKPKGEFPQLGLGIKFPRLALGIRFPSRHRSHRLPQHRSQRHPQLRLGIEPVGILSFGSASAQLRGRQHPRLGSEVIGILSSEVIVILCSTASASSASARQRARWSVVQGRAKMLYRARLLVFSSNYEVSILSIEVNESSTSTAAIPQHRSQHPQLGQQS
jgi:hypothetical protein